MKRNSREWHEAMRAFEEWLKSPECPVYIRGDLERDGSRHRTYANQEVEIAWNAWLAGMSFMRCMACVGDYERF